MSSADFGDFYENFLLALGQRLSSGGPISNDEACGIARSILPNGSTEGSWTAGSFVHTAFGKFQEKNLFNFNMYPDEISSLTANGIEEIYLINENRRPKTFREKLVSDLWQRWIVVISFLVGIIAALAAIVAAVASVIPLIENKS